MAQYEIYLKPSADGVTFNVTGVNTSTSGGDSTGWSFISDTPSALTDGGVTIRKLVIDFPNISSASIIAFKATVVTSDGTQYQYYNANTRTLFTTLKTSGIQQTIGNIDTDGTASVGPSTYVAYVKGYRGTTIDSVTVTHGGNAIPAGDITLHASEDGHSGESDLRGGPRARVDIVLPSADDAEYVDITVNVSGGTQQTYAVLERMPGSVSASVATGTATTRIIRKDDRGPHVSSTGLVTDVDIDDATLVDVIDAVPAFASTGLAPVTWDLRTHSLTAAGPSIDSTGKLQLTTGLAAAGISSGYIYIRAADANGEQAEAAFHVTATSAPNTYVTYVGLTPADTISDITGTIEGVARTFSDFTVTDLGVINDLQFYQIAVDVSGASGINIGSETIAVTTTSGDNWGGLSQDVHAYSLSKNHASGSTRSGTWYRNDYTVSTLAGHVTTTSFADSVGTADFYTFPAPTTGTAPFTWSLMQETSAGAVSIGSSTGALSFGAAQSGAETFYVIARATDANGRYADYRVNATMTSANSAATPNNASEAVSGSAGDSVAIADATTLFTDPEGDSLTFSLSGTDAALLTVVGNSIDWVAPATAGSYSFSITANDGTSNSTALPVTLTVTAVASSPMAPNNALVDILSNIGSVVHGLDAESFAGEIYNFQKTTQSGIARFINNTGSTINATMVGILGQSGNGNTSLFATHVVVERIGTDGSLPTMVSGQASRPMAVGDTVRHVAHKDDIGRLEELTPFTISIPDGSIVQIDTIEF